MSTRQISMRSMSSTMRDRIEFAVKQVKNNLDTYIENTRDRQHGLTPHEAKDIPHTYNMIWNHGVMDTKSYLTCLAIIRVVYQGSSVSIRQDQLKEWYNKDFTKHVLGALGD